MMTEGRAKEEVLVFVQQYSNSFMFIRPSGNLPRHLNVETAVTMLRAEFRKLNLPNMDLV
jgi:hypothetical protein